MSNLNKLSDKLTITQNKLGNGAFGSVYLAKIDGQDVAVKCESKTANNLTLLREFKICKKFYIVKKYIKLLNLRLKANKDDKEKIDKSIELLKNSSVIKIYDYLTVNNMLLIPEELDIKYLYNYKCIPETFSYIECNDFNFLTMELCGENFENLMEKYELTERGKYFVAHRLLHVISCIHRCGIIHRDIKLSNLVLDKKINKNIKELYPLIIDLGLGKEYYKYEGDRVIQVPPNNSKSITGTLRYISLNIHEFKSPTIIDDLISLAYSLLVIFMNRSLPWVGHKKDIDKFDITKHSIDNCKCNYHINKKNNDTKKNNTIAEVKYHTPLEELTDGKYIFLIKWIKYLYSLKQKQLPSYNYLYKQLENESKKYDNLYFEILDKSKV
jgi:serine/threonine protein kinase